MTGIPLSGATAMLAPDAGLSRSTRNSVVCDAPSRDAPGMPKIVLTVRPSASTRQPRMGPLAVWAETQQLSKRKTGSARMTSPQRGGITDGLPGASTTPGGVGGAGAGEELFPPRSPTAAPTAAAPPTAARIASVLPDTAPAAAAAGTVLVADIVVLPVRPSLDAVIRIS